MSLNLAVRNAVMGLGQALNNKMVTNKSSPSQKSFGREGGTLAKETLQQQKYFSHSFSRGHKLLEEMFW